MLKKRRFWKWTKRIFLGLTGLVVVLLFVGVAYQFVATKIDEYRYPAPGELVDVGGHRLSISCVGQGSPTVVLESAFANSSDHWFWVQQELADSTRVCAYDRAGMGWSERGSEPWDAKRVPSELHALLEGAGIEGPYVMVGHSVGGLYTQMYAKRYSEEVAGVALIDSSHPEQFTRLPGAQEGYEKQKQIFGVAPHLARLGVLRLFGLNPAPSGFPQQQRAQVEAFNTSTRQMSTVAEEYHAFPRTFAQAPNPVNLGDKPLAVVSAGEQLPGWSELQDDLAKLSSDSNHRVIKGATHLSVVDDQGHAQATSAAILEVVEAARNNPPLTQENP